MDTVMDKENNMESRLQITSDFLAVVFYCNTDRELCYSFKDVIPVEHWILVRITGCDREKGGREGLPGNKHSVK